MESPVILVVLMVSGICMGHFWPTTPSGQDVPHQCNSHTWHGAGHQNHCGCENRNQFSMDYNANNDFQRQCCQMMLRDRCCSKSPHAPDSNLYFGDSHDGQGCLKRTYSDGVWTSWTAWSACPVKCNGGLMTRTRSCDNPSPSNWGKSCVGSDKDVALCNNHPCPVHQTDGGWLHWTTWSKCSSTCNGGLQIKSRDCNNPVPSSNGRTCTGNDAEVELCNNHPCPVPQTDGNWSPWTPWSTCSSTCNGGLQTRSRSCNNPTPSSNGLSCIGNHTDVELCNTNTCPAKQIYFTATTPNGELINKSRPAFTVMAANVGDGFNETTAIFTSPISGLYLFSTTFTQRYPWTTTCELFHNNDTIAVVSTSAQGSEQSASLSIFVSLVEGDMIFLGSCSNWRFVVRQTTVFTGALISFS